MSQLEEELRNELERVNSLCSSLKEERREFMTRIEELKRNYGRVLLLLDKRKQEIYKLRMKVCGLETLVKESQTSDSLTGHG